MKMDIDMKARLLFAAFVTLVAAAALGWYLVAASRYTTYQIYTKDAVSGLLVDAPVEFHGVEIGKVKSVQLIDPRLVGILLNIERGVPISAATVATVISRGVAARGFTGYVYVSLEDVGTNTTALAAKPGEAYPVVRTAPSKVVTMDTAVNQVNDNVQAMTELMRPLLDKKTVASLRQSIDNLQQVSKVLAENSAKLGATVDTAERASRRVEPLLDSSQKAVNAIQDVTRQAGPVLQSGQEAANQLRSASSRLEPLLQSSQQMVDTIQTQILPQASKAVADLDAVSGSMNELAGRISRDPSVLIRGTAPPPPAPGEGK